jgi:cytochrome c oxidase subunit II
MPIRKISWILLLGGLLSGCSVAPAVFNPASSIAGREAGLFSTVLWMSLPVFLIVDGGLLFIILRYRQRRGDTGEPRQIYHNVRLEAVWTAIPILLVITLFILTVVTVQAVAAPAPKAGDVKVTIVGHRWWWEFDYPDLGIHTANELHIPAGATVQISLQSADVIHSFWVPQLSGKTDVIPGQANTMWLTSDQPGSYPGQCAEFCGTQHANMRFTVIVDPPAAFQAWKASMQKIPAQPTDPLADQGDRKSTRLNSSHH